MLFDLLAFNAIVAAAVIAYRVMREWKFLNVSRAAEIAGLGAGVAVLTWAVALVVTA